MNTEHRLYALDNVRTLMVLLIVLLHASCAYAPAIPWWHAQDTKSDLFNLLIFIIDNFALPTLFCLSGALAHASFTRHGRVGFIKNKLKRLGLPVVLLSVFYLPGMVYVGYLKNQLRAIEGAGMGFITYWKYWMSGLFDWSFHLFVSMESAREYANSISPHHLWFVSLLVLFFLGYALLFPKNQASVEPTTSFFKPLLAIGACIVVGFAGMNMLIQDWAWARFGPFILFQPTRLPIYLGAFILGARLRAPITKTRSFPAPVWAWLLVFCIGQVAMLAIAEVAMKTPGPAFPGVAFLHGAFRTLTMLAGIGLFFKLGFRFWDTASTWRESLAGSSFDIYKLHMPLVVFIQTALTAVACPLFGKMTLAFVASTLLCWAVSKLLAGRNAMLSGGVLLAYFLVFCFLFK